MNGAADKATMEIVLFDIDVYRPMANDVLSGRPVGVDYHSVTEIIAVLQAVPNTVRFIKAIA